MQSEEGRAVEEAIIEEMDKACLEQVLSMSEVLAIYHKSHKTVRALLAAGKLMGRQAKFGSTYLISKRSCDERWPEWAT